MAAVAVSPDTSAAVGRDISSSLLEIFFSMDSNLNRHMGQVAFSFSSQRVIIDGSKICEQGNCMTSSPSTNSFCEIAQKSWSLNISFSKGILLICSFPLSERTFLYFFWLYESFVVIIDLNKEHDSYEKQSL